MAKKTKKTKRSAKNPKHPTATYPRASLKLPKGVDPGRKRAAPKKNPRRRNPDAASAPVAATASPPPAPPAPAPVAAAPAPQPQPHAIGAQMNPYGAPLRSVFDGTRTFTWRGEKYTVGLNFGVAYYRVGAGPWLSVREALKSKRVKPELRAHLKASVTALTRAANARAKRFAEQAAKKVQRVKAKVKKLEAKERGKRNGAVEKAAAAALKAEKHERMLAKKRAGKKNAGKSCAKNPTTAAKPKKTPTKRDFARVVKIFKKTRELFAAKVHANMIGAKLLVDPKIHDSARHFAMTTGKPGVDPIVAIAPELAFEPVTVQTGIIAHEFGHASVMSGFVPQVKGDYDAIERQADKLAEKVTGLKIYYDSRGVEVAGKGAKGRRPRPAGLR